MATYYIDFASGSDGNAGTTTAVAWQHCPGDTNASSNAASLTPADGDALYFKKGVTYNGSIAIKSSGADSSEITYGVTTWGTGTYAIIDPASVSCCINFGNYDYLIFHGLHFTGNTSDVKWAIGSEGGNDTLEIYNCKFVDCYGDSIHLGSGALNCLIHDNEFSGNSSASSAWNCDVGLYSGATTSASINKIYDNVFASGNVDAIVTHGSFIKIYGNTIHDYHSESGHGDGIVVQSAGTTQYIDIYKNLVYDCGQCIYLDAIASSNTIEYINIYNNIIYETALGRVSDVYATPYGITMAHSSGGTIQNIYIENNTIVGTKHGLNLGGFNGSAIECKNNILYQTRYANDYCVYISGSGTKSDLVFDYNQYFHHASGNDVNYQDSTILTFAVWQTSYNYETNGQEGNPIFSDDANRVYTLQSSSPCIDQGTSDVTGAFSSDYAGDSRPVGSAWDIGAYEYNSGAGGAEGIKLCMFLT